MRLDAINRQLLRGTPPRDVLPHLVRLRRRPLQFEMDFGLGRLPRQPGLIAVRGARQYGKSTWLEQQIAATVEEHGAGTALYLNGDEVPDRAALLQALRDLAVMFAPDAPVRRLFIDEVTAVSDWSRAVKTAIDGGELDGVLVVATGSKATDIRRGSERLPGRKGQLARTTYHFTPVSYREFKRVCGEALGNDTLTAYLLSGGAPVACAELAQSGRMPEYVIEMVRDWIYGECAASGRHRSSLLSVMQVLFRFGGCPVGQAKLAREAGLANNTVAAGYIELLADLLCVGIALPWDPSRNIRVRRKPAKFPFINLLAAVAWSPTRPRSIAEFNAIPHDEQGMWWEWLVAQELWRRRARRGDDMPEELSWWQSKEHELDFVLSPDALLEVKRGPSNPFDFRWFHSRFPNSHLTVITSEPFATQHIRGIRMEDFLLAEP